MQQTINNAVLCIDPCHMQDDSHYYDVLLKGLRENFRELEEALGYISQQTPTHARNMLGLQNQADSI